MIMALALATLLSLLDSIAKQVDLFDAAIGLTGAEANTVSKGAANNVATLQAVADASVQADLMPAFRARAEAVKAGALERVLGGAAIQRVLGAHYGAAAGGLNQYLQQQDARVHPNLRKVGFQIDPANAFTPTAVDPVALFAVGGSGVGTYTAGADVDTEQYGKAAMRIRTTSVIGAAAIVATLTMKRADGSTESKVLNIGAGTSSGVEAAIGTPGTDLYIGCTGISISGGTTGDGFKVVSVVERTITL